MWHTVCFNHVPMIPTILFASYCLKERQFLVTIQTESDREDVTVSADEFLSYKGAVNGRIEVPVERWESILDSGYWRQECTHLSIRHAGIEEYMQIVGQMDYEDDLAEIIAKRTPQDNTTGSLFNQH